MFPSQGGFLCFDSFKPFSMSCQAQCLIETHVCFLDIFLVLKFPLPSVYFFFLRTFVIAVLLHTKKIEREREKSTFPSEARAIKEARALGLSGDHPVWGWFWPSGFRWVPGSLGPQA